MFFLPLYIYILLYDIWFTLTAVTNTFGHENILVNYEFLDGEEKHVNRDNVCAKRILTVRSSTGSTTSTGSVHSRMNMVVGRVCMTSLEDILESEKMKCNDRFELILRISSLVSYRRCAFGLYVKNILQELFIACIIRKHVFIN